MNKTIKTSHLILLCIITVFVCAIFIPPMVSKRYNKLKLLPKISLSIIEQLNERGNVVTNWETFGYCYVNSGYVHFKLDSGEEMYISQPFRLTIIK